jgi:hypothetical protein
VKKQTKFVHTIYVEISATTKEAAVELAGDLADVVLDTVIPYRAKVTGVDSGHVFAEEEIW